MPLACSIVARRPKEVVVFGEALQRDVDRALQFFGSPVDDVSEDASLGRLMDVRGVVGIEERDHGAGRLADDLGDQLECVIGGEAEPDERNVGVFAGGDGGDLADVDLAGDHLVPEPGHDRGEQLEAVSALIRDQHAQLHGFFAVRRRWAVAHPILAFALGPTSSIVVIAGRSESALHVPRLSYRSAPRSPPPSANGSKRSRRPGHRPAPELRGGRHIMEMRIVLPEAASPNDCADYPARLLQAPRVVLSGCSLLRSQP
jgi:hypothetical protein